MARMSRRIRAALHAVAGVSTVADRVDDTAVPQAPAGGPGRAATAARAAESPRAAAPARTAPD